MIRDAILIYTVYSAAILIAGIVGYLVLRVFSRDVNDPP